MKIKLIGITVGLLALAIGLAACSETTPGTNANANRAANNANLNANNTAVVVNANTNKPANANKWNSNISKDDYDKDKAGYEKEKTTTEVIGTGINDSWLWFKVRSALAMVDNLRDSTISVSVSNEAVTLAGTVASAAHKAEAEKTAKGITGVKSVKNDLKVAANDSVANQVVNGNTNARPVNSTKK